MKIWHLLIATAVWFLFINYIIGFSVKVSAICSIGALVVTIFCINWVETEISEIQRKKRNRGEYD